MVIGASLLSLTLTSFSGDNLLHSVLTAPDPSYGRLVLNLALWVGSTTVLIAVLGWLVRRRSRALFGASSVLVVGWAMLAMFGSWVAIGGLMEQLDPVRSFPAINLLAFWYCIAGGLLALVGLILFAVTSRRDKRNTNVESRTGSADDLAPR